MNVLVFRDFSAAEQSALRSEFRSCEFQFVTTAAALEPFADWAEIVFGNVPQQFAQRASRLDWLQIVSSGFDDYRTLHSSKVVITTANGVHAPIIAQHVLLMILMFTRGQIHFSKAQLENRWDRRPAVPDQLEGRTIGILGFGAVGREIFRLLSPMDVRVIAAKRTASPQPIAGVELWSWDRLDELLGLSDHLILALPLTDATRQILDASRLGKCKSGAVIHNIARGDLIDETALLARLRDGSLGGAALDVFAHEPLPADSPLWKLPNVIATPHIAGHHRKLGSLMLERFRDNLRRHQRGEALKYVADFERGY